MSDRGCRHDLPSFNHWKGWYMDRASALRRCFERMGPPRIVVWGTTIGALASAWLAVVVGGVDVKLSLPQRQIVEILPLYTLVVLGCYAMSSIGLNLFRFNDCPLAAKELEQDVADAKADLRRKGMAIDW